VPGFGLLWYVAGLGLTSFMPLNVLVSEQRLYLSGAGLVIVAGAIGAGRRWRWQPVAVLALLLAVMTWHRNEVWDTKLSLWSDAAARGPSVDVSRMDQLAPSARAFWGRVQLNLGEAHFERSEYDEARQAYEEAIALRPDSDVAWTNLAVLRERRGDRSGAEDAYRQAIALQPGSHEARSRLGRILLDRGRSAEAIAMLRQSLSIKPSPIALVNLGVARRAVGDLLEAERLMKAALRLDPEYVEAHVNAAILRAMRGMATQDTLLRAQLLHESTELFEAVFVRQPGHRDALVNLAGVYQAARRHHEAGEVYAQLVADHPDFAPGHAGYGRFLLSQGQAAAAVASLRKASELDSLSLQTRSDLAAALVRQNDLQAAAAVLRETCRLNDRRPDLLYRLGAVLAALAEAEDADGSRAAAEELRREALVAYEDAESLHANFRDTAERLRQIRALLPP
jgi:Flp pilus assembly protein TadD